MESRNRDAEVRSKYAQTLGYVTGVLRMYTTSKQGMPQEEVKKLFQTLDTTLWNRIHDENISSSDLFEI